MSDSRRLKRVSFDQESLHGGIDADFLLQLPAHLPKDAKLVRFGEDLSRAELYMVFWSTSFDEVPVSQMIPELIVTLNTNYVSAPPTNTTPWRPQNQCACDVTYTGGHRVACPASRSRRGT